MPVQAGSTLAPPSTFSGYDAACRAAEVLEEARRVAGDVGALTGDDAAGCKQMSALLAIADQYRQLAATMAGDSAPYVLRAPQSDDPEQPGDQRARR